MRKVIYFLAVVFLLGAVVYGASRWYQTKTGRNGILGTNLKLPFLTSSTTEGSPTPSIKALDPEELIVNQVKKSLSLKYDRPIENISLKIEKLSADYAQGTVSFIGEPSGGWWLAFKDKGGWLVVADGNGTVSCQDIGEYNFPVDMVPECFDYENQKLIKR